MRAHTLSLPTVTGLQAMQLRASHCQLKRLSSSCTGGGQTQASHCSRRLAALLLPGRYINATHVQASASTWKNIAALLSEAYRSRNQVCLGRAARARRPASIPHRASALPGVRNCFASKELQGESSLHELHRSSQHSHVLPGSTQPSSPPQHITTSNCFPLLAQLL